MAHLPVQCQNCGARYKIPDTFKSDAAKCKSCGTMIDVKSVRDAVGAAGAAGAAAAVAPTEASKPKSTGGTRKPRATASSSRTKAAASEEAPARRRGGDEEKPARSARSRRGSEDEGSSRGTRSRRGATSGGRRSRRGEEDGEEGGRYEKKKDNTGMIAAVSIGALLIVGLVGYFVFFNGDDPDPQVDDPKKVAAKDAGANKGDAKKESEEDKAATTDPKKDDGEGDAKAADAGSGKGDSKPVEGDAKKPVKKAPKKKPAKAKKDPKKAKATITKAEDVYKPSELDELPQPEDVSEEELDEANSALDSLMEGSGLGFIRAPAKLQGLGYKILPIVANRMRGLDYSKAADNDYAFILSERVLKPIARWSFGFGQSKVAGDFKLQDGHANALRVKAVHQHARLYWANAESWAKFKKKHADKFK